jgi:hypothetical protein
MDLPANTWQAASTRLAWDMPGNLTSQILNLILTVSSKSSCAPIWEHSGCFANMYSSVAGLEISFHQPHAIIATDLQMTMQPHVLGLLGKILHGGYGPAASSPPLASHHETGSTIIF